MLTKKICQKTNHQLLFKNNQLIKIFSDNEILEITKNDLIYSNSFKPNHPNLKFDCSNLTLKEITYQNQPYRKLKIKSNSELLPFNLKEIKLDNKILYKPTTKEPKFNIINSGTCENFHHYKTNALLKQNSNFNFQTNTFDTTINFIYSQKTEGNLLLKITNNLIPTLSTLFPNIAQTLIKNTTNTQTFLSPTKNPSYIKNSHLQISDIPFDKQSFKKHFPYSNQSPSFVFEGIVNNIQIKPSYSDKTKETLEFILEQRSNSLTLSDTIVVKKFNISQNEKDNIKKGIIENDDTIQIVSQIYQPSINDAVYLKLNSYQVLTKLNQQTQPIQPRTEFSVFTKMSDFDGVSTIEEYYNFAKSNNLSAIAFTDNDGLYAYPKLNQQFANSNIKPIYGLTINFLDDNRIFINNPDINANYNLHSSDTSYVIFDLETTGLSKRTDKIIEIAALKIKNNEVIDRFETLINPEQPIPLFIENLTNISNDWLKSQPMRCSLF